MSETKTKLKLTRWTLTGASDGPQGLDGVPELARTAYADMMDSDWQRSEDAPMLPVHDFDREQPKGDAYKAVWGYDADARSERSCCGAVCYTYAVPADALAGETCLVESVAARVIGDRYLDQGAVVRVVCTNDEVPPPATAFGSLATSSDPVCATNDQLDEHGEPIAPNKRSAVRADVSVPLEATPATRFVHIGLFLFDYLAARGAWIEGGAMLSTASVTVTFSRAVADDPDPGAVVVEQTALNLGLITTQTKTIDRIREAPFIASRGRYKIYLPENYLSSLSDSSYESRVRNVLAALLVQPGFYATAADGERRTTQEVFCDSAQLSVASDAVTACSLAYAGRTRGKMFDRLTFKTPISSNVPFHLVVFGIDGPILLATTGTADPSDKPDIGTPLLSYKTLLDKTFLSGKATSIQCCTNLDSSSVYYVTRPFNDEGETTGVSGRTLACIDCPDGHLASVDFEKPWETAYFSTVVLAFIPNDIPTTSTGGSTSVALTIRADTHFSSNLQTNWDRNTGKFWWETSYSFMYSGMTASVHGHLDLHFSATIDGKSYTADEEVSISDFMPSVTTWDSNYYTPPGGTSTKTTQRATMKIPLPEISGSVMLKADDESEVRVTYTIPARTITRYAWAISMYSFMTLEWNDNSIGNLSNTATRSAPYATSFIDPGYPILQRTAAV